MPTIILGGMVRQALSVSILQSRAHHRFVNTTPNPRATKKRSGLLVGPSLLLLFPPVVEAAGVALEVVVGGKVELEEADILKERFGWLLQGLKGR